jgi:hypothetical protein
LGGGSTERHLFEYRYDGSEWGIEIKAASAEEAQERLKALAWAQYKGRVIATIPAAPEPIFRFAAFLKNIVWPK